MKSHTHVLTVMSFVFDAVLEPMLESAGVLAEPSGVLPDIVATVSGDTAVCEPTESVLEQHRQAYAVAITEPPSCHDCEISSDFFMRPGITNRESSCARSWTTRC